MAFTNAYGADFTSAIHYDFTKQMAPNVWLVHRKYDRMPFLAKDMTPAFSNNHDQPGVMIPSTFSKLLAEEHVLPSILQILKHDNLMSMHDLIPGQATNYGAVSKARWYVVWDYCDAGTLANLFVEQMEDAPEKNPLEKAMEAQEAKEKEDAAAQKEAEEREAYGETMDVDASKEKPSAVPQGPTDNPEYFLPESFVWHVLTSMMKALAWLHDGCTGPFIPTEGTGNRGMMRSHADPGAWQTILHRNINPLNIFLAHPKRDETYGMCKLGNYSKLWVTAHSQGLRFEKPGEGPIADQGPIAPMSTRALAPHPEKRNESLGTLYRADALFGNTYPLQPNQPYTVITEIRALGEIIQGMMVKPRGSGDHISRIRANTVQTNLQYADYTAGLKNFVVKMMEVDEKSYLPRPADSHPWNYITSRLTEDLYEEYMPWIASQGGYLQSYKSDVTAFYEQRQEDLAFKDEYEKSRQEGDRIYERQNELFKNDPNAPTLM
ncbi:hypothetical protein F4778DRAFT_537959 [Xylariomycetidae sp. FL2044]|nr:hypothetical protein F4778DRAFT_537959 [Xylariomycetidae sp. FL2044]